MFPFWANTAFNLHVAFCGITEQNLSGEFNIMLLCLFVLVIEVEKLEVCIHEQNYIIYIVEKPSEIHKHE